MVGHSPLRPDEIELTGSWSWAEGKAKADAACERIDDITRHHLIWLRTDPSGWDTLFRDPSDGRLWELTHRLSSGHGAGPPQLKALSLELATKKYGELR